MIPHLSEATGKAHCRICKQKIARGERCVCYLTDVYYQHPSYGFMHKACLSNRLRNDAEDMGLKGKLDPFWVIEF